VMLCNPLNLRSFHRKLQGLYASCGAGKTPNIQCPIAGRSRADAWLQSSNFAIIGSYFAAGGRTESSAFPARRLIGCTSVSYSNFRANVAALLVTRFEGL